MKRWIQAYISARKSAPARPRYLLLFFGVLLAMLVPAAVFIAQNARQARADWYDTGGTWAQRKLITIDDAQVSGSSNHTNFPVLISLTSDSDLSSNAQADGDDIVFTSSDGTTKLDHEIEAYSAGTLVAWVEIPTLSYNADTVIYMYYGNDAAANQENVAGTWNSDYLTVYHLEEQVTDESTSATHYNSTSTSANGTQNNNDDATGQISRGQDFDDTNDYIEFGDNNSLDLGDGTDLVISAWINADTLGDPADIVSKKNNNTAGATGYKLYYGTNNLISLLVSDGTDSYEVQNTTAINSTSNWYYITAVFDENNSTNSKIFINGVDNSGTRTGTIANVNSAANSSNFRIGSEADGTIMFDGMIDEVRLRTVIPSSDWIATEYANQNSPGSFYSVGSVENNTATLSPKLALKFDEGLNDSCPNGSDACDSSGNNNHATISGATWQNTNGCTSGSCLLFDGSDDVASVTNASVIDFDNDLNEQFTISTWVKVLSDGESSIGQIFNKGSSTYCRTDSESNGNVDLECGLDLATTDATLNITNGLNVNQWHHVSVSFTDDADDEITIYIDGINRGSSTNGVGSLATDANNLLIGGPTTANFHGFIDEFRIYAYQATDAQAAALAIKGAGLSPTAAVLGVAQYDFMGNGLVGYYSMEGGATSEGNTTADVSGAGNNATLMGDNGSGDNGSGMNCLIGGKFGYSCDFDGTDDYLTIADQDVFSFGNGTSDKAFSVSAWVNADADNVARIVAGKHRVSSSGKEWTLVIGSTDLPYLLLADESTAGSIYFQSDTAIPEGSWVHLAATYDGSGQSSGIKLYINGKEQTGTYSDTSYTAMENTTAAVQIGGDSSNTNVSFDGKIDDVRIYNRRLSSQEASSLADWSAPPLAHYKFDNPIGITFDNAAEYADNANSTSMSFDFRVSDNPNRLLLVSITAEDAATADTAISGVTYAGQSMTQAVVAVADSGSRNNRATLFYLLNPPVGSATVSVTFGGNVEGTTAAAYSFYNVDQAAPDHTGTYTSTSSISSSISITPIVNNSLIVDVHSHHDGNTGTNNFTGGSGQIEIYDRDDAATQQRGGSSYKIFDTAGATTMTQSANSTNGRFAGAAAAFAPAPITAQAIDSSGNGNNGYPKGGLSGANKVPGIYGSALSFDGSDDLIDLGTSLDLQDLGGVSVSAWVYYDSSGTDEHQIISNWEDVPNQASVNFRLEPSNDTVEVFIVTQTDTQTGGSFLDLVLTPNKWHHVAFSYDSTNGMYAYLDGRRSATTYAAAGALDTDASPTAWLGHSPHGTPTDMLTGKLDDVRVYNYARTPEQIVEDMNGAHPLGGSPIGSQVSFWNFDEATGTTAQNSISTNTSITGTISGATWTMHQSSNCKVNNCLDFDGSDDVVTVTNTNAIDLNVGLATGVTFSAWINADSDGEGDTGQIFQKGTTTFCRTDTQGTTDLDLECSLDLATTDATVNIADALTTNTWHHVVMGYTDDSDDEISVWVDGKLRGTSTNGVGSPAAESSNLLIGGTTTANFDGTIDEFKIYSSELSKDEILLDYNANAGINFGTGTNEAATLEDGAGAAPVLYWAMNENTGTTVNDLSGNGNNGTLSGTAKFNPGFKGSAIDFSESTTARLYRTATLTNIPAVQGSMTVSWWFKQNTANAGQVDAMWQMLSSGTAKLQCGWRSSAVGCWKNGGTSVVSSGLAPAANQWHYFTYSYDGTTHRIYLNGILRATSTTTQDSGAVTTIEAGYNSTFGGEEYDGIMDEIKVWNYVLTPAQIAYDYNRGNPMIHLKLDECTGTTLYDASSNLNATLTIGATGTNTSTGTCGSGTASQSWNNGTSGKFSSAVHLDGTDDYLTIADNNMLTFSNGSNDDYPFSVSVWVNPESVVHEELFNKASGMASEYTFSIYQGGLFATFFDANITNFKEIGHTPASVQTGQWQHLVMTYDGTTPDTGVTLYLNSRPLNIDFTDTVGSYTAMENTAGNVFSGSRQGTSTFFNGQLDDLRIYNYELSRTQIKQIMNEGSGVRFGE